MTGLREYAATHRNSVGTPIQAVQKVQPVQRIQRVQHARTAQNAPQGQPDILLKICERQQQATKESGQSMRAILTGLQRGENIYCLFVTATKCISDITGNQLFTEQAERDIMQIYGQALNLPEPLTAEREAVLERLERLKAYSRAHPDDPQGRNLQAAIKAHEQRAAAITDELRAMAQRKTE